MKNNRLALKRRKAQSVAEYSICVGIVLLSILAMVTYVKRGISGRYADVVRATQKSANTVQYEPYYYNSTETSEILQGANLAIRNRGGQTKIFDSHVVNQGSESYSTLW